MSWEGYAQTYPLWAVIWGAVMVTTVLLSFPFALWDWRARWVALSLFPMMLMMNALYDVYGYARILSLPHFIFWTPLLIYLIRTRNSRPERKLTRLYVWLTIIVFSISLPIDYFTVGQFILGQRGVITP